MTKVKIIRCSSCGSSDVQEISNSIGKCSHCGSTMFLPRRDEEIINLLNSAQVYRENFNYDLAIKTYQFIIEKDSTELSAYEGLLLAEYGIEYVKDAYTGKMMPTCHRAHFSSILEDPSYQTLLTLSNDEQKKVIEEKAKEIDKLQHSIKRQLENEESFDVFISYKAEDANGDKTEDSLIAREIYEKLTEKKYKVFFAEKTLENRLGSEYEPIIFKALNTCKIFILVGTSKQNVEANWVRNEWSRFLDRMKSNNNGLSSTSFIPVYKTMSPYDMPKVNNTYVQGVDASKIGYIATIVDGVQRLLKPASDKKVLEIFEDNENLMQFENIRKKKILEIKKNNWKDLQTNPKRKKEKFWYNLFVSSPIILGIFILLMAFCPLTWFLSNPEFYLFITLCVIEVVLATITICVHQKKYPLNAWIRIVFPFSSAVMAVVIFLCFMLLYPFICHGEPYWTPSYNYAYYYNGFEYVNADKNCVAIGGISKIGLQKHTKMENGKKILVFPKTIRGQEVIRINCIPPQGYDIVEIKVPQRCYGEYIQFKVWYNDFTCEITYY